MARPWDIMSILALLKSAKFIIGASVATSLCTVAAVTTVVLVETGVIGAGPVYHSPLKTNTMVGFSAKYLGTVKRNIPTESHDGGLDQGLYPRYGSSITPNTAENRNLLLAETKQLLAGTTGSSGISVYGDSAGVYTWIDSEGNYRNNDGDFVQVLGQGKLFKHTGAAGNYRGDVSDSEPAVIKEITYRARTWGDLITGLYAPPGELITVEMSSDDYTNCGGLDILIGPALPNGQQNNIWTAKGVMNRMPLLTTGFMARPVDTSTGVSITYIGSTIGGPIYIRPRRSSVIFKVKITGAVKYSHYIYGYTTAEEFDLNKNSTAPYFDLEVWGAGIRHSGPKIRAQGFSYEDLTHVAELWEKVTSVSNQIPNYGRPDVGVTMLYDCFVAAGAAVAFPGRFSTNCPDGWMTNALSYSTIVASGGWGVFHEYNHNYQRFGAGAGGEVTNNAVTLISYALYTKISAARTQSGGGIGGWNRFTSASNSLLETITIGRRGTMNRALDGYATLLHSFGPDTFLNAASRGGGSPDQWYRAMSEATHNDMTFYMKELLHFSITDAVLQEYAGRKYPMFVPVASIYQTGRAFTRDGERVTFNSVQPFEIDESQPYEIDMNQYIVVPDGFTFTLKSVSQPELSGSISKKQYGPDVPEEERIDNVYVYKPVPRHRFSGAISVVVKLTASDELIERYGEGLNQEVELLFGFKCKQTNADKLDVSSYIFDLNPWQSHAVDSSTIQRNFIDAQVAYENNYFGDYKTIENTTQLGAVLSGHRSLAVRELRCKGYISEDGDYRFILRGGESVALYASLDQGTTWELIGKHQISLSERPSTYTYDMTDESTYKDYNNLKKGDYVYFKGILSSRYTGAKLGIGWGKFETAPGGSNETELVNEERTVTITDMAGMNINAYYEEPEFFVAGEPYKKTYTMSWQSIKGQGQQILPGSEVKYRPWDDNESYSIQTLFDEDETNYIHSHAEGYITEDTPFEITVDIGQPITAQQMVMYGAGQYNDKTYQYIPKDLGLYIGNDPENLEPLELIPTSSGARVTTITSGGLQNRAYVDFNHTVFRYYKLHVNQTARFDSKYIALRLIRFFETYRGNMFSPDDARVTYRGKWSLDNSLAYFGHLYVGQSKSTVEFTFKGTRFAIYSHCGEEYQGYDVHVDGKNAGHVDLSHYILATYEPAFISNYLSDGEHKVKIIGTGVFNVDAYSFS